MTKGITKKRTVEQGFDEGSERRRLKRIITSIERLGNKENDLLKQDDDEDWEGESDDDISPKILRQSAAIVRKIEALEKERDELANLILDKTGKDPLEHENNLRIKGLVTSCGHYMAARERMSGFNEDDLMPINDMYERLQEAIDYHLGECGRINQEFINAIPFVFGLTDTDIDLYAVGNLDVSDAGDQEIIERLIPLFGDKMKEAIRYINKQMKSFNFKNLTIRIDQIERAMVDFEPIKQAYLDRKKLRVA